MSVKKVKRKPKHKIKSVAVLTMMDVAGMTKKGRRDIAKWLRRQADFMLEHGSDYSDKRFIARYLCEEK